MLVLRALHTLLVIYIVSSENSTEKLGCDEIRFIVDRHNFIRTMLTRGRVLKQPAAINMTKLSWDNELAEKASGWAKKLSLEKLRFRKLRHNHDRTIRSKRFETGELLYLLGTDDAYPTYKIGQALESWFEESSYYIYEPIQYHKKFELPYGHYTQMIWANTLFVGCGMAVYNDTDIGGFTGMVAVCNYGPPGNVLNETPYVRWREGDNFTEPICKTRACQVAPYGGNCDPRNHTSIQTTSPTTIANDTTNTVKAKKKRMKFA